METLILLVVVFAAFLLIHEVRTRWTTRSAAALGLDFTLAPAPEHRDAWRAIARRLHDLEPTTWGHVLRGTVDGSALTLLEQELKPTVSSNREWHTLVIWTLPNAGLPVFNLFRPQDGRPWIRQWLAPLVDPAVRALGGDPDPAPPSVPVPIAQDAEFARRHGITGPDPDALIAHFDAARRKAILALAVEGPVASDGQRLIWLRPGRAGPTVLPALLTQARALRRSFASA